MKHWIIRDRNNIIHMSIEAVEGVSERDVKSGFLRMNGIAVTDKALDCYKATEVEVTSWQSILDLEIPCHILDGRFELMYAGGGHGGPIQGLREARKQAQRYLDGCQSCSAVHIVPCDERPFHPDNAVEVIRRK